MSDLVEAKVDSMPNCDVCSSQGTQSEAAYDGKTIHGPWAFMCEKHFQSLGIGLGEGRGQRLILRQK